MAIARKSKASVKCGWLLLGLIFVAQPAWSQGDDAHKSASKEKTPLKDESPPKKPDKDDHSPLPDWSIGVYGADNSKGDYEFIWKQTGKEAVVRDRCARPNPPVWCTKA